MRSKKASIKGVFGAIGFVVVSVVYWWLAWEAISEHPHNFFESVFLLVGMLTVWFGIMYTIYSSFRKEIKNIFRDTEDK